MYLFHFTVLFNPSFSCSKRFSSFSVDKVTTGTYNFVSVILNVAFFGSIVAGLSPCADNTTVLCDKTQVLDKVKVKDTSQLINDILSCLSAVMVQ